MEYTKINGKKISKLSLGTVQLGLNYGIANKLGKPSAAEANSILEYAFKNRINSLDTAASYGESETIIGNFFQSHSDFCKNSFVSTKLMPIIVNKSSTNSEIKDQIDSSIQNSIKNLKIEKIHLLMLHRSNELLIHDNLIYETLLDYKNNGLIENIGVSIYNPEELEYTLKLSEVKFIQAPMNLFDTRLINSSYFDVLKTKRIKLFIRSIYLQGLFFYNIDTLPSKLQNAGTYIEKLSNLVKEYEIPVQELALGFIKSIDNISSIVIGSESVKQVADNIMIFNKVNLSRKIVNIIKDTFHDVPNEIINPSLWNR